MVLDVYGDGQWTDGVDISLTYGQPGDIPIAGDWNGSGKANVGVFPNGMWILDANGNGQLDVGNGDATFWLGNAQYVPLVMH